MIIASIGAIVLGAYLEAVIVILFFQVGEFFEEYAVEKSRKSISLMLNLVPEMARVIRNGKECLVSPSEVGIGERILICPGERVPIDGVVVAGNSSMDTSALTGESLPHSVGKNDTVISGCINIDGVLEVQTTCTFENSSVSRIMDLVEKSSEKKAKSEKFVRKFAKYYTPIIFIFAVIIALIPPLIFMQPWSDCIYRALIFLVVSCPCALVISIPLAIFGGIGAASRHGILVKGGKYFEMLAKAKTIVFDKTGTLTTGSFTVLKSDSEALYLAVCAGCESTHPLSIAIRNAWGKEINRSRVSSIIESSGRGLSAIVDGNNVICGNSRYLSDVGVIVPEESGRDESIVYVAKNGIYVGSICLIDTLKKDAKSAFRKLGELGISQTCLLTGDRFEVAERVSSELGIHDFRANLLPHEKVGAIEEYMKKTSKSGFMVYVGDGINDAPVLARSDVGVAMGAFGSDVAIEAADIVLMDDSLEKIPQSIQIARKTGNIVTINIVFVLLVKFMVLGFALSGFANMAIAVFADVGVSVLAILNSMRLLRL